MLIECLLKRDGPIVVPIGNEVYRFEDDGRGRRVAEVWLDQHVEMFLSSGAAALYRRVDEPPPRRDDPAYRGPDPAPRPDPITPPVNGHHFAEGPEANTAQAQVDYKEPEAPMSAEAQAQTGIGGYARTSPAAPAAPPVAASPPPPAPQVKFNRKELIARAKELGINNPHSTPSATLELAIRERTS